jgi:PPK2 family polyphosphate:nucleotide phosphotransferase
MPTPARRVPRIADFRYDGRQSLALAGLPTRLDPFYADEADHARQLADLAARIDQLQNRMHAHERYGLVLIFQALDAAGKDSSIRHVFSGVNPSRFRITGFKKPSDEDQKHDFLWRFWRELPERGMIGIFNRSYYEEVLALRVHPERLREQLLPEKAVKNEAKLWRERYADIVRFEEYLARNGFPVLKFYLHVSKEEQGQRLINRLRDDEKQWKFSESDLKEREFWPEYQRAYEAALNATATRQAPWYVIPSDDRANQQLIIAHVVAETLARLPIEFPEKDEREARKLIRAIERQDGRA